MHQALVTGLSLVSLVTPRCPTPTYPPTHPPAGGAIKGGRSNELLWLDLSTWTWSQPTCSGTAPSPRSAPAIALGQGHYLFVSGGRNNFVLEDLVVCDLLTHTWAEVRGPGGGGGGGRGPGARGGLNGSGAESSYTLHLSGPDGAVDTTQKCCLPVTTPGRPHQVTALCLCRTPVPLYMCCPNLTALTVLTLCVRCLVTR